MPTLAWLGLVAFVFLVVAAVARVLASAVDRLLNRVALRPPYQVPEQVREKHARLFVADLHADPLLWQRNLLKRHGHGHVDLPRLVEGNVALQVFAAVTKVPWGINFDRNPAHGDMITALALAQGWPPRAWGSLFQRALHEAQRLERFATRSQGRLMLVKSAGDLDDLMARRQVNPHLVGALLALEGVHALEGDLANLDRLADAGFRVIGLVHFFDNEAGGSAHGMEKGGLTPFGREVVRRVQERRLALDLAHASPRLIDGVLEMASAPVIVSHTGLRGTCDSVRNLDDERVRRIAATGGLIGVALFEKAVCGNTVQDTARAIRYAADLVGVEHVAVGSDFDGAVKAPLDASGWALLTGALVAQGFGDGEVAAIMGGNALRVLRQMLSAP